MTTVEKRILTKFKHLLEKKVQLRSFAVFGSRARGNADPDSDMDVLVVVDHLDKPTADYISECAWESCFGAGIVLVPIAYSYSEWNGIESQSLLARSIKAEGIFL